MARVRYRTVWISDTHLGSKGAQAARLSAFLKSIDCQRLYLVGDIVDFWRLRRGRSHWPDDHNDVVRRLLKLVKRGTAASIIPGNHDAVLRQYDGLRLGGFVIEKHAVHECLDGRRLLVIHGDQYDLAVKHSPLLCLIGSAAYEQLLVVNRWHNRFRKWRGKPYWSLAQHAKLKVKSACTFISRYRESVLEDVAHRGLDGIVCGHIHQPELTPGTPSYYNCGDWIENCTALVEHHNGEMELVHAEDVIGMSSGDPDVDGFGADVERDARRAASLIPAVARL